MNPPIAARESREEGFTQPRAHSFAEPNKQVRIREHYSRFQPHLETAAPICFTRHSGSGFDDGFDFDSDTGTEFDMDHLCVFPFKYGKATHNECIWGEGSDQRDGDAWCPREVDNDSNAKDWYRCKSDCKIAGK